MLVKQSECEDNHVSYSSSEVQLSCECHCCLQLLDKAQNFAAAAAAAAKVAVSIFCY